MNPREIAHDATQAAVWWNANPGQLKPLNSYVVAEQRALWEKTFNLQLLLVSGAKLMPAAEVEAVESGA